MAAFGTASLLDCSTLRDGEHTSFRLNYDHIRKLSPTDDYEVEDVEDPPALIDPDGNSLAHGTSVRLRKLKMKRAISEGQFLRSLSRRFALNSSEMKIHINSGTPLKRFDISTEFRFPADGVPHVDVATAPDGWAEESVNGHKVRWWIGFTEKPLDDDHQQY